jgi:hypothetical protein
MQGKKPSVRRMKGHLEMKAFLWQTSHTCLLWSLKLLAPLGLEVFCLGLSFMLWLSSQNNPFSPKSCHLLKKSSVAHLCVSRLKKSHNLFAPSSWWLPISGPLVTSILSCLALGDPVSTISLLFLGLVWLPPTYPSQARSCRLPDLHDLVCPYSPYLFPNWETW